MTSNEWIKKHRAWTGKIMIQIDFQQLMEDYKFTIEKIATICGYSNKGIEHMLARGTCKPLTYHKLKIVIKNIDRYVIDKKGIFRGLNKRDQDPVKNKRSTKN